MTNDILDSIPSVERGVIVKNNNLDMLLQYIEQLRGSSVAVTINVEVLTSFLTAGALGDIPTFRYKIGADGSIIPIKLSMRCRERKYGMGSASSDDRLVDIEFNFPEQHNTIEEKWNTHQ